MRREEEHTLEILSVIESVPNLTQRMLAARLSVALGTANKLIRHLGQRKWIELRRDGGRPTYHLTQAGVAEKLRLSKISLKQDLHGYAKLRDQIAARLEELNYEKKRIVLYGAGDVAEIAFVVASNRDFTMVGIVDDEKTGQSFLGHVVASPSLLRDGYLNGHRFDGLVVASDRRTQQIRQNLRRMSISPSQVFYIIED